MYYITGDWHFHQWTSFSRPLETGLNGRLEDQFATVMRMIERISRKDIFIILGDMFRSRRTVETVGKDVMNYLHRAISKCKAEKKYLLVGNHDLYKDHHALEALSDVAEVIDVMQTIAFDKFNALFIPYTEDKAVVEIAITEHLMTWTGRPSVMFGHLGIVGSKVGWNEYVPPAEFSVNDLHLDRFAAAFFAHYHKHQQVANNGWYVGSPYQMDFGDGGDNRGYMAWDGTSYPNFFNLNGPRFLPVIIDSEKAYVKFRPLVEMDDTNYWRLIVKNSMFKDLPVKWNVEIEHDYNTKRNTRLNPEKVTSLAQAIEQCIPILLPEGLDKEVAVHIYKEKYRHYFE